MQSSAEIPFGIAQIGKAFPERDTPATSSFDREFEQMEMQYFVKPGRTSSCSSSGATSE